MINIKSTSYSIVISENVLEELSTFLEDYFPNHEVVILVDENTEENCLSLLSWENSETLRKADTLCVPIGEESKSLLILSELAETLLEMKATRNTILINLGGGVVSDLGGFLAATYKRGIPFINLPTTLLAMVDASAGGKTGVNLGIYKNQLGAFNFPEAVFCCTDFLNTLPKKELLSGFAEVIKHGLIADKSIWESVIKMDLEAIPDEDFIARSITVKNEIVKRDPLEKGERKKLNFGHTIGHAFESMSQEDEEAITHGTAVAMGMVIESFLSVFHSKLPKSDLDTIREFIFSNYSKFEIGTNDFPQLFEFMESDKKNEKDGINFTLLKSIGSSETDFNLSKEEVSQALKWYMEI